VALVKEAGPVEFRDFDRLARAMAAGVSRRSMLRRAVGSAMTSPLTLLGAAPALADGKDKEKNKDKDRDRNRGNSACRDVGHPCMGNQECCAGLTCVLTDQGSALRCMVPPNPAPATTQSSQTAVTNNQVCAGDCDQTNQQAVGGQTTQSVLTNAGQMLGQPPTYWVDVACQFDARVYQTICTCTGHGDAGAPLIRNITLPSADICAVVVTEEMRPANERQQPSNAIATGGEASAGTGGVANADASGGTVTIGDIQGNSNAVSVNASGGTASADASGGDNNVAIAGGSQVGGQEVQQVMELSTLTLTLEGEVAPGRQTTYWVDTDAGRRPAAGPALVQVADETSGTGAIVVEVRACAIPEAQPGFDWFGQCTAPATNISFSLYPASGDASPLATMTANAQGRAHFGNLPPGTYHLEPQGALWCYAESDRVDANGNVIVEADTESHVWSFTCAG
jgi:hypothetical protein